MHALCLSLLLLVADDTARWPGFLGADATPPAATAIPLTWSADKNIAWKADLPGHGQSSPIVWDGQVFVTAISGDMKEKLHVLSYDLASGKQLWQQTFDSSDPVKDSLYVSRAAPTPVTDGEAVYCYFESGDVLAISIDGKKTLWQRSLSQDYGKFKNKFGLSASPVQTKESVIILVDDEGPSYLVALSKAEGKVLWKTDRSSRVSWSSPALVEIGGAKQVVCSSAGSVDGYDPATGKQLWTYGEVGGNTSSTPLGFNGGRFLVGASVGREAERAENAKKSNFAMTIELVDGRWQPKLLWKTEQATPSFGSPVVIAGHAYWVNRQGVVYCFDAETGELRYNERTKQSVWATPVGVGDRVYLFGKDGVTTVLKSGPKFEVLAENKLWNPDDFKPDPAKAAAEETPERRNAAANFAGPVQYGVAIAGRRLLIRTGERLYCVGE